MKGFKKGDPVWCKRKDVYKITEYHIPCTAVEYYMDGIFLVDCFGAVCGAIPRDFELIGVELV